ncbi:hypothetical protein DKP78_15320 [Enterococcus faecium]|nr:hypothetical protein DKP78_15320 [Enterococcus faecium]
MTLLPHPSPPFMPQSTVPYGQNSQFAQQPESHLGQMDVNDLLSKLISTGIIKPATTDSSQTETTAAPVSPPAAEEEEEEEAVVADEAAPTGVWPL